MAGAIRFGLQTPSSFAHAPDCNYDQMATADEWRNLGKEFESVDPNGVISLRWAYFQTTKKHTFYTINGGSDALTEAKFRALSSRAGELIGSQEDPLIGWFVELRLISHNDMPGSGIYRDPLTGQDMAHITGLITCPATSAATLCYRIESNTRRNLPKNVSFLPPIQHREARQKNAVTATTKPATDPLSQPSASEIARRLALLSEYKKATGKSEYFIYTHADSGIHKPEFREWKKGLLRPNSATLVNFERFLKEKHPKPMLRKKR